MATSKDKTPKVMDVSHPGRAAPPASAKPIIVTNRPMLKQDPMMVNPDGTETEKPDDKLEISRTAKTISVVSPLNATAGATEEMPSLAAEPASDTIEVKAKSSVSTSSMPPAPTAAEIEKKKVAEDVGKEVLTESGVAEPVEASAQADAMPPAPAADPDLAKDEPPAATESEAKPEDATKEVTKPDDDKPEPSAEEAASSEASEGGTDGQLAPNQALDEAKRKEEEARAAVLAEQEKIVASKQFYLPMSQTEERRGLNRVLLVLVLVLFLALVWADIVVDAGIIRINGVPALTHFFN